MNHNIQYQLVMNRQAELLRQATDHRRATEARSASGASQMPARRVSVELRFIRLPSFSRQRSAHIG
jgi:hypothetical protein